MASQVLQEMNFDCFSDSDNERYSDSEALVIDTDPTDTTSETDEPPKVGPKTPPGTPPPTDTESESESPEPAKKFLDNNGRKNIVHCRKRLRSSKFFPLLPFDFVFTIV